jgi:hypothetical protein
MPISFSSGNGGGGSYLRVNMPQNRLAIDTGFRDWQAWPGNTETVAPGDNYKRGFELDCWVSGGRHGTFSGNSYGQTSFIERLYNEAEKAPEFAAGKVPMVKITASTSGLIAQMSLKPRRKRLSHSQIVLRPLPAWLARMNSGSKISPPASHAGRAGYQATMPRPAHHREDI